MLLLVALLSLGAFDPRGAADELDQHLAALGDPRVQVRHGAERWLSANVEAAHVTRLVPLILDGDAEIRHRISRIVAQADSDLTITAALLNAGEFSAANIAAGQARLASVARQALEERINRWNRRMSARGETDSGLSQILAELAEDHGPRALRVSLEQSLEEVCALLERHGALPIGITVEAEIRERALRRPDEAVIIEGWSELISRLTLAYGVDVDLFGFERTDEGGGRRGFLRFTARPGTETGEEVLVRWFRQSTTAAHVSNRIAAARNLAASGWPDALAWLEARYRSNRDEVALEGLLYAAATGRVAPILFEGDVVRALVRRLGEDLDTGDVARLARAHRTIDALRELGCLGRRGEDLASVVLQGWEDASDRARWGRLAILEAMRCPTASGALDDVVQDPGQALALRVQALRAWSAATSADTGVAAPRELPGVETLIAGVETAARAVELARLLASAGFRPPAAWTGPEDLPADWGFEARVAFFGWVASLPESSLIAADRAAGAGRLGLDLLARAPGEDTQARGEAVAEVFSIWVERGDRLRLARAWQAVRAEAPDDMRRLEVDRVALLARLIPAEQGMAVYQALRIRPLPAGSDLAVLAVAAGWGAATEAEFARQRLTVLLQEALSENRSPAEAADLILAIETAMGELQRMGMDPVALEWRRPTIRGLIRRYGQAELARGLRSDWPPYPVRRPVDPAREDRRLMESL